MLTLPELIKAETLVWLKMMAAVWKLKNKKGFENEIGKRGFDSRYSNTS